MKPFGVICTQKVWIFRFSWIFHRLHLCFVVQNTRTETVERAFRLWGLKRTCECLPVSISTDCIHGECNAWRYRVTGLLRSCYQCSFRRSLCRCTKHIPIAFYKSGVRCCLFWSIVFWLAFSCSGVQIKKFCVRAATTLPSTGSKYHMFFHTFSSDLAFIHRYIRCSMMLAILALLPFNSFILISMRWNATVSGHCLCWHTVDSDVATVPFEWKPSFRFDGILHKQHPYDKYSL